MDFEPTDGQVIFRNMAREFTRRFIQPVAKDDDKAEHFRTEILKQMVPLGLLGAPVPEGFGGLGVDSLCYAVICEEIGGASFSVFNSALRTHTSLVQETILACGDDSQRQQYLPRLAKGELIGCYALDEPEAGSDPASLQSTAVLEGNKWLLTGTKVLVTNGGVADLALVVARIRAGNEEAVAAFLVERGTPGWRSQEIRDKMGLRGSNVAQLSFQKCSLPEDSLLGGTPEGFKAAMIAHDNERYSTAACCVGVAQTCINTCVNYAQERQQFGRPIGSFQLIQNMIVDMVVQNDAAKFLVYRAGALKDKGLGCTKEIAVAKYFASEAARQATNSAVQIHGAYGLSVDFPLERYYRDTAIGSVYEETPEILKLIIGRAATGISALKANAIERGA